MTPSERLQQSFCIIIEAGDVECGSKGFDAIKSPWATVVDRICSDKIWHCEAMSLRLWDSCKVCNLTKSLMRARNLPEGYFF